jgi:serine/threonine protein kinase
MFREVASLRTVRGAGGKVPEVYDENTALFGDGRSQLFLVMEFVEGETLSSVVEKAGVLQLDEAISLVLSICDTIRKGHAENVLHRDLKPENLILPPALTEAATFSSLTTGSRSTPMAKNPLLRRTSPLATSSWTCRKPIRRAAIIAIREATSPRYAASSTIP